MFTLNKSMGCAIQLEFIFFKLGAFLTNNGVVSLESVLSAV